MGWPSAHWQDQLLFSRTIDVSVCVCVFICQELPRLKVSKERRALAQRNREDYTFNRI